MTARGLRAHVEDRVINGRVTSPVAVRPRAWTGAILRENVNVTTLWSREVRGMGLISRLFRVDNPQHEESPPHAVASTPCETNDDRPVERWYAPSDGNKERFVDAGGLPTLRLIPYTDTSGERVLRLCENDTGLLIGPTDTRLAHAGILVSQLRGETYHKDACRRGDFSPGAAVQLVPEPDNPHDHRAVAVYDATGEHHCAYVNKQKARAYLKRLAAGEQLEAISLRGTPVGKTCEQVAVLAASPRVLALLLSPRPDGAPVPAHRR